MANRCMYKMVVRGKKNACYAFYAGQLHYVQDINYEGGSDENYKIRFSGECKWTVDSYCVRYDGEPVELPEDCDEAMKYAKEVGNINVEGRAKMYSVSVIYNSTDLDDPEFADACGEFGVESYYYFDDNFDTDFDESDDEFIEIKRYDDDSEDYDEEEDDE